MGFEKKKVVIYEGEEATYVLKNGLKYRDKKKKELWKEEDYVKRIIHNIGYENWKRDLESIVV